jgi:hypothetical protein
MYRYINSIQIFELDLAKTCTALNQQQQLELEDGWEDVNDSVYEFLVSLKFVN